MRSRAIISWWRLEWRSSSPGTSPYPHAVQAVSPFIPQLSMVRIAGLVQAHEFRRRLLGHRRRRCHRSPTLLLAFKALSSCFPFPPSYHSHQITPPHTSTCPTSYSSSPLTASSWTVSIPLDGEFVPRKLGGTMTSESETDLATVPL